MAQKNRWLIHLSRAARKKEPIANCQGLGPTELEHLKQSPERTLLLHDRSSGAEFARANAADRLHIFRRPALHHVKGADQFSKPIRITISELELQDDISDEASRRV